MKNYQKIILSVITVLVVSAAPACSSEMTASNYIKEINVDANTGYIYFYAPAGWGAPSCPGAYYAMITPSSKTRLEFLALGLFAKKNNSKVRMQVKQEGCSPGAVYIVVEYIILE